MSEKKWVLITGASAGLGLSFSKFFAKKDYNLVLLARRKDRLQSLAVELSEAHDIVAEVFACDLSQPSAAEDVVAFLKQRSITISILVNNAGYGVKGRFSEIPWQQHADFLQVLSTSVVALSHALIPAMKEQGYGRILNVASLAALTPDTAGTLYNPVKAFILRTSISLDLELKPFGIRCTATCPGLVHTSFHEAMDIEDEVGGLPSYMWLEADEVVEDAYKALMKGKVFTVPGKFNKFIALMFRFMPLSMQIWMARVSGL